jgi:inosine-uridine nucleoside N-ribohydrolase
MPTDLDEPVWVDCDPGLGVPFADVDDALALWFLHARGVRLAGFSSVFGNTSLAHTDRVLRALGARFGVPVVTGAGRPGERDTDAARALRTFEGTVLAIGPMTNIAAALAAGARFRRLVVLGGTDRRLPNLRPLHTTELNFAVDLPAAAEVLACSRSGSLPLEVVPMEPCRTVWFGRAELAHCPDWLRAGCRSWLATSPLRTGAFRFHPWDLLAAAWLVEPSLFRSDRAGVTLDHRRVRRGHVSYVEGSAVIVRSVDTEGLRRVWMATRERAR